MAKDCVKARFSIKMAHKTKRVFHNILRFIFLFENSDGPFHDTKISSEIVDSFIELFDLDPCL